MKAFWDRTPRSLVEVVYIDVSEMRLIALIMEEEHNSETSIYF
jgi:hypothetical protein